MTSEPSGQPGNTIRGGIYQAPVIQATGDVDASFHLPAAAPVALAQLPLKAADFTGRDEDMAKLAGLLDPVGGAAAVVVSAVTGLAGVGKTTLAVQAGHAAVRRGWFGGGVLFIDLHGYDQEPVKPSQALDALLRALGVPAEHIPATVEERAALYRSAMAQITDPVLVIADNASSDAQVKPLLPGTGCHRVLVTSRHTLAGLGARLLDVTVLDDDAAIELLDTALRTARPDDDRVSGDQRAARRLARACGGLPLALQIIAALLNTDLPLSASDLADQLAVEAGRLERLRYDDGGGAGAPSVAAAFEMSYRKLDETQAREFRLLAFNPGPGASTAAISVLADLPVSNARSVLADLARAHLVEAAPGTADRWRMHDLVRIYGQRLYSATTSTWLAPPTITSARCRAKRCPQSSPAAMLPWTGWIPNGPAWSPRSPWPPPPAGIRPPCAYRCGWPVTWTGGDVSTTGWPPRPSAWMPPGDSATGAMRA